MDSGTKSDHMKKVDILKVLDKLNIVVQDYDVPVIEFIQIQEGDPFKVLIATILSARTKDEMTSKVCKKLFTEVKGFEDLERLSVEKIADLIYPVGFFKQKAKHLKAMPEMIKEKFNGVIPQTIDELVELPGVGRKTANLTLSVAFDIPAICVDIHVFRIMNRLGYTKSSTPVQTEMTLRKKIPKDYWQIINRVLVAFGQHLCTPINPKCNQCPIREHCNRIKVKTKYDNQI